MPVPTTAISCIGWFKGIRHLRNLAALKLLKEKSFYETLKTFVAREVLLGSPKVGSKTVLLSEN